MRLHPAFPRRPKTGARNAPAKITRMLRKSVIRYRKTIYKRVILSGIKKKEVENPEIRYFSKKRQASLSIFPMESNVPLGVPLADVTSWKFCSVLACERQRRS